MVKRGEDGRMAEDGSGLELRMRQVGCEPVLTTEEQKPRLQLVIVMRQTLLITT
jgi:hypothetical protein